MVTTRNPFIDPIEAPDLATKIVAKDGTDDAGYVTVGDVLALTDVVNVKAYGAVGDGVTNDTAAFAAAIASGRDVYIPAGTFNITSLTFSDFLSGRIRGAGRNSTIIYITATGTGMTFDNCQWMQLSDFTIQTFGTPHDIANCSGIELNNGSSNSVIERVNFVGFSLEGLKHDGSVTPLSGNVVRQCYFLGNGRYQLHLKSAHDFTIDNNQFGMLAGIDHAEIGCYLEGSNAGTYTKNMHWSNVIGLKAEDALYNRYIGNRVEENDHQNVYVDGGYYMIWEGNTFHTGSQEGPGLYDYVYFNDATHVIFVGNHIFSWDAAKWGRYGVYFDSGCDELVIGKNIVRGYDETNYGPWGFDASITRIGGDRVLTFNGEGLVGTATYFLGGPGKSANQVAVTHTLDRHYAVARLYAAVDGDLGGGNSIHFGLFKAGVAAVPEMSATIVGAAFVGSTNNTTPQILYDTADSLVILATTGSVPSTSVRGYLVLLEY